MAGLLAKSLLVTTCTLLIASLAGLAIFFAFHQQREDGVLIEEASLEANTMPRPLIEFRHHNNSEINSLLISLTQYYPRWTRLYSIGRSTRNHTMLALEITDNPGVHEPGEPELKLVGNIHGNEVVGRELLLYLIDYLLVNYEKDEIVRQLVDSVRLHIVPTINPDGYEDAEEGDCDGVKGRANANQVDLNRNFPDQFFEQPEEQLQLETENVITWTRTYPFVLSLSLHGGALVVNYPYDGNANSSNRYSASPDDQVFQHLALLYSQNNPEMKQGRCSDLCSADGNNVPIENFPQGITNGAAWYPIYGGMQDWNYVQANCFEITVELGCKKYPTGEELERYWRTNLDSLVRLINAVHLGVHGFVLDQVGRPVEGVAVSIAGIGKNVSSYKSGDYWRLLTPNALYTVAVWKEGYMPQSKSVYIEQSYQLNFTLLPSS